LRSVCAAARRGRGTCRRRRKGCPRTSPICRGQRGQRGETRARHARIRAPAAHCPVGTSLLPNSSHQEHSHRGIQEALKGRTSRAFISGPASFFSAMYRARLALRQPFFTLCASSRGVIYDLASRGTRREVGRLLKPYLCAATMQFNKSNASRRFASSRQPSNPHDPSSTTRNAAWC